MPLPHFTTDFVACLEIVGGLLLLSGWLTRMIAVPFIMEMIVAILSTKISLYLGTSPLPLPAVPPKIGMWAVLHEVRSEYAQLLTVIFLMINGPGRWSVDYSTQDKTANHSKSARSCVTTKRIRKCIGNGVTNDVLVLRAQKPAQPIGIHNVLARHVGNGFGRDR